MRHRSLPPLYLISDAARIGEERFLDVVSAAAGGGLRMLQLREPGRDLESLRPLARRLLDVLPSEAILVLNCRPGPELAARLGLIAELGLGGAHLGGASPQAVRELRDRLGSRHIIGYSAHSPAEAREALLAGASYTSVSPVFSPLSKPAGPPPLGIEALRRAVELCGGPVYALGGITAAGAAAVAATGAAGVAVMGALLDSSDPRHTAAELLAPWQ